MIASEFALYARTGGESLRISDVTVAAGGQTCHVDGKLRIADDSFELELNTPAAVTFPGVDGYEREEDSWQVRGLIEEDLRFSCTACLVSWNPFPGIAGRARLLATSLTVDEHVRSQTPIGAQDATQSEDLPLFRSFGLLPNLKLLGANCGTHVTKVNDFLGKNWSSHIDTLKGETAAWEFGLVPEGEDLTVHLHHKKGFPANEDMARRDFRGLLSAISFTHGVQAWPQHFQLWRGNRKLEDSITPARKLPKSSHPFLFHRHCVIASDLVCALTRVTLFLSQDDEFAREIERLIFLARLAGTGDTPLDVGTLSLCAIFQGFVDRTFEHFQLEWKVMSNSKELREFAQAKSDLIGHVKKLQGFSPSVIERLQSCLGGRDSIRLKEKFRAVVDHLGLPWNGVMEVAFKVWDEERSPLAHGARVRSESDEDLRASWRNQSCLACAINILFAKLCGYSGVAMYSTVEEKTDICI